MYSVGAVVEYKISTPIKIDVLKGNTLRLPAMDCVLFHCNYSYFEMPELFGWRYFWLNCQNFWLELLLVELPELLAGVAVG